MDRKSSRTTTVLVIAGVAALSAVALYFVAKFDRKDTKKTPKEVNMSTVPEDKQDEEDKGAAVAPPELVQAAQHSRVDADTAKPPAQTTTAPGSKPQGATAAVMSESMAANTPAAVTKDAEPKASNGSGDAAAVVAWRQTGEKVTLEAACPSDLRRKDVLVTFTTHSVHVEARGQVIADGQLFAPIAPDECCWEFGQEGKNGSAAGSDADSKRLIVDLVKAPVPQSRCLWQSLYAGGDAARAVHVY